MILVEHCAGVIEVQLVLGALAPRQFGHQFQIGAGNLIVGGVAGHAPQALKLPVHFGAHVFRQVGLLDLLAQFGDVLVVFFAQGLLNGPLLLAQQVLALLFVDVLSGLLGDLASQFGHLEFVAGVSRERAP